MQQRSFPEENSVTVQLKFSESSSSSVMVHFCCKKVINWINLSSSSVQFSYNGVSAGRIIILLNIKRPDLSKPKAIGNKKQKQVFMWSSYVRFTKNSDLMIQTLYVPMLLFTIWKESSHQNENGHHLVTLMPFSVGFSPLP